MLFRSGKKIFSFIIKIFEKILKTILIIPQGTCRFYPSCSDYAQEAIRILPFHKAVSKITIRLIKCNPCFKGGFDPVVKE